MITVPICRGGAGQISATLAAQYRRLTLPHIAAGSKTFFGNVNKRLIGKTDYVRTSENPATPAFDSRQPLKAPR
ncbi:hypothetical protein CU632_00325 [Escherichia coli]|nr:hypothetical protein [Escherichia coli]MBQ4705611.1 hypothetical protein [Escherichia coli]MDU9541264.1 hypothetical protein [Escherichia coli]NBH55321.1 hypothetical protein [Escherichia coli]QED77800.1 hypothetical protein FTV91_12775 [Escherichia coli]